MKMRRLPEIDLARIAVLEREEKEVRLRQLKAGHPSHTYGPMRKCLPDVMNLQGDLISVPHITPWDKIDAQLRRDSKHASEYEFNEAVARALYDYALENRVISRQKQIPNWSVGFGQSVTYWWNLFAVMNGRPYFPFVDPRLSHPLTAMARRFVFSVMHERIRVVDPDFANAGLLVFQFSRGDEGSRVIRIHLADDVLLFSYEELNAMITETYRLWLEVLDEREDEARRSASGGHGPLFD